MYTLLMLYIKQVTNEDLLWSTRSSRQHPATNRNGNEYVSITESPCCTAEMNMAL